MEHAPACTRSAMRSFVWGCRPAVGRASCDRFEAGGGDALAGGLPNISA